MKSIVSVFIALGLGLPIVAQTPANPVTPPKPPGTTPTGQPVRPTEPVRERVPARPPVPGAPAGAIPGLNPAGAGKVAAAKGPNAMAATAGQVIDGSNWDDQDVADEYTKYTGKRVLLSSATQNLEIRFYQRGPLTNRQAADLLVKVLDMEGFVFVPSGANEVKLLPKAQGTGSNGPNELEGIIDNPDDIPNGDDYISYFMKLSFIKPEEAVRTFTQSIHGLGAGAKIAPVPNASAVLITAKAAFVRKLINQKKYIDVPTGNVDTTWVGLQYADSEELAATLNEIMNAQQQRKTTAGVTTAGAARTTGNRPPIPGTSTRSSGSSSGATAAGEDIPVQIVADPRLNRLFIMGRPVDIIFVEGLARKFDAQPNRNTFVKRKLRFMIASDFLQVAANALEASNASAATTQGSAGGRTNNRQTTQNRNQNNNRTTGQNGNRGGTSESVQEFDVNDVPESIVVGKTFIVADNIANSILVQGPPESLRIVSELLDKLDGRPQQVMISTVFGKVTLGKGNDVGVSVGKTSNGEIAGGTNSGENTGLVDLSSLTNVAGLATQIAGGSAGLNLYGAYKDFAATLIALESNTNFEVLSRPTVFTANNRRAVISSGQRIAVPTNTSTSGQGTQNTNIEYRDVLLRFEVVPLINSEEEVTLRISLVNEDTQGFQIVDNNRIPTIVTESIFTTVTVPNKSTVVLGGLVTEAEDETKAGVPILSSIPGIGRLFSRTTKNVERSELLIFIQPTIISGEQSHADAQEQLEKGYKVAPAARKFGGGVLPDKPKSGTTRAKTGSKTSIPTASQRPALRYPTRR